MRCGEQVYTINSETCGREAKGVGVVVVHPPHTQPPLLGKGRKQPLQRSPEQLRGPLVAHNEVGALALAGSSVCPCPCPCPYLRRGWCRGGLRRGPCLLLADNKGRSGVG